MNISISEMQGRVPVSVLQLEGELDGSNYDQVIAHAEALYSKGARDVLVDMSQVKFMSSAGLVALHSIALAFRGEKTPTLDDGWSAMHASEATESTTREQHVKILNPQPKVMKSLTMVGFDSIFEIHDELAHAIASF